MQLSDGRRIGPINNNKNTIPVHKNFRMIILGNRPGYPFQGNDFLYFLGGTFAYVCFFVLFFCTSFLSTLTLSHTLTRTFDIGHPDVDSEQKILKSYAPDLNEQSLLRLQRVFQDLRELEEDLSYPYSTRELVAVIRHLDRFPRDGITGALRSVFDFEQWNEGSVDLVRKVLRRHGIAEYVEGVRVGRVLELKISERT
jgi:von Willebrand factor A domain-containing protein 8